MKLAGVIFSMVLLGGLGCSEQPVADKTKPVVDSTRPLVFLTHPTEPPFSYVDKDGNYAGTNVELARRIAEELGVGLKIEAVDFEMILPRLKAGKADFGIATITITEARRRDVDFSEPYETGGVAFLYRADGVRPRMSQLASIRVGVEAGTMEDFYLCRHGSDPIRYANMNDAMSALEAGVLDAIFFDGLPLRHRAEASGGRFKVSALETRDNYGVAVSKTRPDVLAAANRVIARERAK